MTENTTDVVDESQLEAVNQDNPLAMSDEDFMNESPEAFNDNTDGSNDSDDDGADEDEQLEEGSEVIENESLGDDQAENDSDDEANEENEDESAGESENEQADELDESSDDQPKNETSNDDSDFDYEAEYKKLFEPIKSSGREIKMRNVEHIRNYIQMGDDYNKKMHEIKPYMKSLRTLKDNNILGVEDSDDRINFLIELDQKKPEAIKRLIAESGIDIYELQDEEKFSPEESKKYVPENKIVSEADIEIEDALKYISQTDSYEKTIDVMTNKFDAKSRDIIAENPSFIRSLNEDISSGAYDKVMDEVQYARDMKMIPAGMSDIEAYIATVQSMSVQNQQNAEVVDKPTTKTTTRKATSSNRKKKVGMSSSSSRPAKKKSNSSQDFIGMSDEAFAKLDKEVL